MTGGSGKVQAALGFLRPRPASRASIFAGANRTRAMCAAYTGVVRIMQGVVGHIVRMDVIPHLLTAPVDDGIDLHQLEFFVPLHLACRSSSRGLGAPDGCDARRPDNFSAKGATLRNPQH